MRSGIVLVRACCVCQTMHDTYVLPPVRDEYQRCSLEFFRAASKAVSMDTGFGFEVWV